MINKLGIHIIKFSFFTILAMWQIAVPMRRVEQAYSKIDSTSAQKLARILKRTLESDKLSTKVKIVLENFHNQLIKDEERSNQLKTLWQTILLMIDVEQLSKDYKIDSTSANKLSSILKITLESDELSNKVKIVLENLDNPFIEDKSPLIEEKEQSNQLLTLMKNIIFDAIPQKIWNKSPKKIKKRICNKVNGFSNVLNNLQPSTIASQALVVAQNFIINEVVAIINKYSKNIRKGGKNSVKNLCDKMSNFSIYDQDELLDDQEIEKETNKRECWDYSRHQENETLLWWQNFGETCKYFGEEEAEIDTPLIPDGFRIEFIKSDNIELIFRCNECDSIVYFTDMLPILEMRKNDVDVNYDCQNCYVNFYENDELTNSDLISSSLSDSQEDEKEDSDTE